MKTVTAKLLKIRVSKFLPKDQKVELSIIYSTDSVKEILKTEKIAYPESLARRIMAEIRKTEKSAHTHFSNQILESNINVFIDNEEGMVVKLSQFLDNIRSGVEKVARMKVAEGYIDAVRNVSKMELKFD